MNITVKRYGADHPAPDIVEPILTDIRPALDRGRAELDKGEPLQTVRITALYIAGIAPGALVEIKDYFQGGPYRGKVVSVEHSASGGRLITNIEIVRR